MTKAKTLASLRDLQKLREEQSKADHARAISSAKSASSDLQQAKQRLAEGDDALARYADEAEIELSQFQILASLVNQLEADEQAQKARHDEAASVELLARTQRKQAEKRTELLSDRHRETVRQEQRKAEERRTRDYLSSQKTKRELRDE